MSRNNIFYCFMLFQSGNLHSAFRVIPVAGGSGASAVGSLSVNSETVKKSPFCMTRLQTYDLYMHNDCFTQGHTQWFYFSVKNVVVGQSINFNIKNFMKSDSLFTEGKLIVSFIFLFCICSFLFSFSLYFFSFFFFCYSFIFSCRLIFNLLFLIHCRISFVFVTIILLFFYLMRCASYGVEL